MQLQYQYSSTFTKSYSFFASSLLLDKDKEKFPRFNPVSVNGQTCSTLLQNLTDDAIASLYVTKFSKISLYLNKLYVTYCRALQHTVESSVTYIAKSAHNLSNSAHTYTYIHTLTAHIAASSWWFLNHGRGAGTGF